jgi:hypothetical protein
MDWRTAFLVQARSDYEVAVRLLRTPDVPLCHSLHYLQMTLEKLAKGMRAQPGSLAEPPHTHAGATKLVQMVKHASPISAEFHRVLGKLQSVAASL